MAISALEIRYVLLEWTEGEDRGAHSILALDCVRNFSVKTFLERTEKNEKLVEWRKGRQPWPVHRARIIDVNLKKLSKLNCVGSRWRKKSHSKQNIPNSKYRDQGQTEKASKKRVDNKKRCPSKYNHEEEEEKEEEEDEARHDRPSKNKRASEEEERIGDEEDIVPPSKKKTAAEFRKHLDEQMWERRKLDQMQRNLQELRNEVHSLKNENARLKDIIINQIPQMKSDIAIIAQKKTGRTPVEDLDSSFSTFGEMQPTPERRQSPEDTEPFKESPMVTERFRETPQTAATAETSAKTQMEVIKGSGVFCQAEAWKAARLAPSATAMVRNLLLGTFDLETLLKSNLNGGKPTRGDGDQLVALDQIKKAAIIDATLKKWPAASRGQIGTSINSKLTELRRSTR
ncbi:cancer-related regulator of actin dynamics homolog isoform X3 [Esox lucius]|uniref:cancer-related regulator of actin dynamics homolog isoform X3 n=2 Tax=Esox lucius TaxID=8010 RepID=UPI0014776439|nr:cancer-related regulator of actin dynamics homolog isoform X3 [Esox lucius]XP_034143462.1 cancer-related regulator of actin dynamics homolog isoform X3 [Esox lucius]XP_034143893.1 cancer-related regulator of actin dynamics homolog isoform X3 [Esox lucius]XP_034144376.1 cancer-related regulator of actin dynamics homolog isoform X3 [Esox lucius]XP_034145043.1 cancer-related regulator of actin dynamics homolog isoform X3 [Esox lucius]XP_034145813.1 cancer-related regulator of actin dynamics ho